MPNQHLATIAFMRQMLKNQPSHKNEVKLSAVIFGRKIKGYKPGDGRTLTNNEIEHFREELAGLLKHWNTNGNQDQWLCQECGGALTFKIRFRRTQKEATEQ